MPLKQFIQDPGSPILREVTEPMPESQTVGKCAELRDACQKYIFEQIDKRREKDQEDAKERHEVIIKRLDDLQERVAYQNGRASATASATGTNEPVALFSWLPSTATVLKVGALIGALAAGTFGGCQGARMALQQPAPAEKPER